MIILYILLGILGAGIALGLYIVIRLYLCLNRDDDECY